MAFISHRKLWTSNPCWHRKFWSMLGTIVKCLCWKDKNRKCIGGSAMHTPIKKKLIRWCQLWLKQLRNDKIWVWGTAVRPAAEWRTQISDEQFLTCLSRSLALPFLGEARPGLLLRAGDSGATGDPVLPGRMPHCWNRDNDSTRYFKCSSDHGRSWCSESKTKQWQRKMTVHQQLDTGLLIA